MTTDSIAFSDAPLVVEVGSGAASQGGGGNRRPPASALDAPIPGLLIRIPASRGVDEPRPIALQDSDEPSLGEISTDGLSTGPLGDTRALTVRDAILAIQATLPRRLRTWEAMDLTQSVLCRLVEMGVRALAADEAYVVGNAKGLVRQIAVRLWIDCFRKSKRQSELLEIHGSTVFDHSPSSEIEDIVFLRELLARLNESQLRRIFCLGLMGGTEEEIAEALGLSRAQVRRLKEELSRALDRFGKEVR